MTTNIRHNIPDSQPAVLVPYMILRRPLHCIPARDGRTQQDPNLLAATTPGSNKKKKTHTSGHQH